ncbi:MAG: phosphotransferase [Candidatus Obscuribacterales bacterium]|nr:phosphotransferase [Steroidobacteraceae bacterium]
MEPAEFAAEALQIRRSALATPRRIKSGLTNESWLVEVDDGRAVVVRLSNPKQRELQINRASETAILLAVGAADIGAPVLLCDPERHLLVTQYLRGRIWSPRDARQSENIQRMGKFLRALHVMPPPDGAQPTDLRLVIGNYWNTLMARGLSSHTGSAETRERARQIAAEISADFGACLCHNDIHHLNVIDDGKLRLIDWEYAGIGDPYFDLASLCCYHTYSDGLRRELLAAYLGADRPAALERLHRMCWLFDYIRELWFAVREMA